MSSVSYCFPSSHVWCYGIHSLARSCAYTLLFHTGRLCLVILLSLPSSWSPWFSLSLWFQMFWDWRCLGEEVISWQEARNSQSYDSLPFIPFFSSFLFTFGCSKSVGIPLWTVKIQYLPRASVRAENEVTNRFEGRFASVFLFLRAKGQCDHPLNVHCASNLWSSLLMGEEVIL